jgi:hypothetical protein
MPNSFARNAFALLAALALQAGPAISQETVNFRIAGIGTHRCPQYKANLKDSAMYEFLVMSWVQGYFTAYNIYNQSRQVEAPSPVDIRTFLDTFCDLNSSSVLVVAASDLLVSTARRQGALPPKLGN